MKTGVSAVVELQRNYFGVSKEPMLTNRFFTVDGFTYKSGVEAVEITIGSGTIIWTPFMGSEIWDWKIEGVSQKFEGFRSEPMYGAAFLPNYGAFLIHCGVRGMGGPSKDDTHPHHGELPISTPRRAWLEIHQEDEEFPLSLRAEFHSHIPFVGAYTLTPTVKIHASGKFIVVESTLLNLAQAPFEYQYLGHLNFTYPKKGTLNYSIGEVTENTVRVLSETFEGVTKNPELLCNLDSTRIIDPEVVAVIDHGRKAPSTYTEKPYVLSTMVDEKERITWVLADTSTLDHTVVWLTQTPDRKAAGFALPATSGPTGFTNEKNMGNIKVLHAKEQVDFWYAFGVGDSTFESDLHSTLRNRITE